jgi:Tfp pilus assembly protein PilN
MSDRLGMGKPDDLLAIVQAAVDKKDKEHDVHWSVKVFGGTLVSVVAIVFIGLFQGIYQNISECRNQTSLMLQKSEYEMRVKPMWENIRELNKDKNELTALKERVRLLEQQNRDLIFELQKVRDRLPPQK